MKRVNVGVVALNASSASSDVKAFSNKRCDENDTELKSTANCIDQIGIEARPFLSVRGAMRISVRMD